MTPKHPARYLLITTYSDGAKSHRHYKVLATAEYYQAHYRKSLGVTSAEIIDLEQSNPEQKR